MTARLFTEISLRDVRARNRIVVSPMCQYSAKDGHVSDWHLVHLGKFAQGGAGIVFVEATAVEKRGRITHGDTGIWDDAHIAGLRRISQFLKEQGAVPGLQLAHAGRKASMARPWYGNGPLTQADLDRGDKPWSTIAPTATPIDAAWITPRAMKEGDFQVVLEAYRNATRRALAAGFEVLELHAAHGYLLHTFLSPLSNPGPMQDRIRFPLQVAQAVRKGWPASKPLFVRLSSTDAYEAPWREGYAASRLLLPDVLTRPAVRGQAMVELKSLYTQQGLILDPHELTEPGIAGGFRFEPRMPDGYKRPTGPVGGGG